MDLTFQTSDEIYAEHIGLKSGVILSEQIPTASDL